jgi:UDP-2,3-diacylglucosamine hydrolase
MQILRRTWFVSDLHLDPSHPEITNQFIALLDKCDKSVEDLYVLGDLFELWIGDDDHSPFLEEILRHMQNAASRGTRLHIMRGNRDFLIGQTFIKNSGCALLGDEEKIDLYGTPVLIMHGDTLCTEDTAYLRARKWAHNKWIQRLFLLLPLSLRKKIASKARAASKEHTSKTAASIMDVTQEEVARKMLQHGVTTLIHGHTHRPDIHHFLVKDQHHTRIVLPAWHDGGSVFEWRESGEKELIAL